MDHASPSHRPLASEPAGSAARLAPQIGAEVDPDYARGVVLVALAGVFWSIGGLLIRLIEAASGWQIVLFRSLALALTLTLIIALRHRGRLIRAFRDAGWNGVGRRRRAGRRLHRVRARVAPHLGRERHVHARRLAVLRGAARPPGARRAAPAGDRARDGGRARWAS